MAQGKFDAALARFQFALHLRPDLVVSYCHQGDALFARRQLAGAAASYRRALELKPDLAAAHFSLGNVLRELGQSQEAVASYRESLRLEPALTEAHYNLANTLAGLGHVNDAVASYLEALRQRPDFPDACNNLGTGLCDAGNYQEAVLCFRQALRSNPGFAEAHNNLACALKQMSQIEEAVVHLRQALLLKPTYAKAHYNLANAMQERGSPDEAITAYRQAVGLEPDWAQAYANLGNALKDRGELGEALACYQEGMRLRPDLPVTQGNLVFLMHYLPEDDPAAISQQARQWAERFANPLVRLQRPHDNVSDSGRRLRIGYVSPDFRSHAVAHSLVPVLANHDRKQVGVYCYAEVSTPDFVTDRLRGLTDVWRPTLGMRDEEVAELVRQDQIDVLVDLALHTCGNRLLVFAQKPAPVQVTWCGYPGTTGLSAIDYRLTDPYLDPPGETDAFYTERSFRLPDTFWCYDPLENVSTVQNPASLNTFWSYDPLENASTVQDPPWLNTFWSYDLLENASTVQDSPCLNTFWSNDPLENASTVQDPPCLTTGTITFGCLNNFCKINDAVLGLWAEVLRNVNGSRLLLLAPPGSARQRVQTFLGARGIREDQLEFADRLPRPGYLKLYHRIYLCLDPFPYNGHTTTLDGLWMGVPVITLAGRTVVSRAGLSQLTNLGLPELVARTPGEYVARATKLAGDRAELQALRSGLRQRLQESPLMDGKSFARHLEAAYRTMWRAWCQDRAPQHGKPLETS
jgi:predicted O-linked N-acetylglucosamine transferase (SPINDLY family)